MALNRQPVIATIAMMRTPEESPNEKESKGINPKAPKNKPMHPAKVRMLPIHINTKTVERGSRKAETIKVHPLAPDRYETTSEAVATTTDSV